MIARADDELVARIVAALLEDRLVHSGENHPLIRAGARLGQRRVPGKIGELGRPAGAFDLGRRFDQPQDAHQLRDVDELAGHAVERRRDRGAVPVRQPLRRGLPADAPAGETERA